MTKHLKSYYLNIIYLYFSEREREREKNATPRKSNTIKQKGSNKIAKKWIRRNLIGANIYAIGNMHLLKKQNFLSN